MKQRKFSNCLLETLKAKLKAPRTVTIKMLVKDGSVHFYWYDAVVGKHYAFHAINRHLPNWCKLWFRGRVKEYRWHDSDT